MTQAALDRNDIIEMARQTLSKDIDGLWLAGTPDLEAFAKLVAAQATAKERETCAKVCEQDSQLKTTLDGPSISQRVGKRLASEIRARGQQ